MKIRKLNEHIEDDPKRDKVLELLYKYRVDFSTEGEYTDFGIREEDFEKLSDDIVKIFKSGSNWEFRHYNNGYKS